MVAMGRGKVDGNVEHEKRGVMSAETKRNVDKRALRWLDAWRWALLSVPFHAPSHLNVLLVTWRWKFCAEGGGQARAAWK
jgi:hypothetical protein